MTATEFTLRLVDHALAELAERVERMPAEEVEDELEQLLAGGRSASGDMVAAILSQEISRRDRDARG